MKARIFNFLVTLFIVCMAAWGAWVLYLRYLHDPWTRDSQVRANIVGITYGCVSTENPMWQTRPSSRMA